MTLAEQANFLSPPGLRPAAQEPERTCVLPILMYHKVAEIPQGTRHPQNHVLPSEFARQLTLLRMTGFSSISFDDYLEFRAGRATLPRRPIIITFDDGYRSNNEIAVPLLHAHGFSATIFLVSSQVGRTNAWDSDELQEPLLSPSDIRTMRAQGVRFGSHTRTHARLTSLPAGRALAELRDSRLALEDLLGERIRVIAYPWGAFDSALPPLAAEAGYDAGAIVRRRVNFASTPLFALRRIGISQRTSMMRFAWDLLRLRWRGD
jgi:peptidoglycan/xylan/chitin deacetylase (PgdA/CDA1 family)